MRRRSQCLTPSLARGAALAALGLIAGCASTRSNVRSGAQADPAAEAVARAYVAAVAAGNFDDVAPLVPAVELLLELCEGEATAAPSFIDSYEIATRATSTWCGRATRSGSRWRASRCPRRATTSSSRWRSATSGSCR